VAVYPPEKKTELTKLNNSCKVSDFIGVHTSEDNENERGKKAFGQEEMYKENRQSGPNLRDEHDACVLKRNRFSQRG
jgi:hypothetical protein